MVEKIILSSTSLTSRSELSNLEGVPFFDFDERPRATDNTPTTTRPRRVQPSQIHPARKDQKIEKSFVVHHWPGLRHYTNSNKDHAAIHQGL